MLQLLRRCYAKLGLTVNEAKTAVAPVWERKFLGYSFWAATNGEVRRTVEQRRRGTTIFRELHRRGASRDLAARIAGNAKRWWRNSAIGLNFVLTIGYFDRLHLPRFS